MFCPNCGNNVSPNDAFCDKCGSAVSTTNLVSENKKAPEMPPANNPIPTKNNSDKSFTALAGIIAALLVVLIVLLIVFIFPKSDKKKVVITEPDDSTTTIDPVNEPDISEEEAEFIPEDEVLIRRNLPNEINNFLAERGVSNDVAVAIVDNTTGECYASSGAHIQYPSWGFYLPVYMAFSNMYPNGHENYKANIMSNDAGKCNSAANFAIDSFGGVDSISDYIHSMGFELTTYGRKFGDVKSTRGNFTTAQEAANILYTFYLYDNPSKLCYNPKNFGVTVPTSIYGTNMYAQFGTENAAVKKNFNIFAIMQGTYSDYSIAIMTKNGASANGLTNELLSLIHQMMEG